MGFRSTLTTEDYNIMWPDWFVEKYKDFIHFREDNRGPLAAKFEAKVYDTFMDLCTDIQKAIDWDKFVEHFILVYLHECGGVTRCQISKSGVKYTEPETWVNSDGVEHTYCYGCSDAK